MGLRHFIKRWRTSRGFGVHSPFAFEMITKVLRQYDDHYYAYAEVDAFCPRGRQLGLTDNFTGFDYSIPEARLLFRLLCYFNPPQVLEVGQGHEVTYTILTRAVPHASRLRWIADRPADIAPEGTLFILVNYMSDAIVAQLRQLVLSQMGRKGGVVVFVRHLQHQASLSIWHEIYAAAPHGIDFNNGHVGLFCGLSGLPRQSYELDF